MIFESKGLSFISVSISSKSVTVRDKHKLYQVSTKSLKQNCPPKNGVAQNPCLNQIVNIWVLDMKIGSKAKGPCVLTLPNPWKVWGQSSLPAQLLLENTALAFAQSCNLQSRLAFIHQMHWSTLTPYMS